MPSTRIERLNWVRRARTVANMAYATLPASRRISVYRLEAPVIFSRSIVLSETVLMVTIAKLIPRPDNASTGRKLQNETAREKCASHQYERPRVEIPAATVIRGLT